MRQCKKKGGRICPSVQCPLGPRFALVAASTSTLGMNGLWVGSQAQGTSNPSVGSSAGMKSVGACRSAYTELSASAVSGIRIGSSLEDLGCTGSLVLSILHMFPLATNANLFDEHTTFFLVLFLLVALHPISFLCQMTLPQLCLRGLIGSLPDFPYRMKRR